MKRTKRIVLISAMLTLAAFLAGCKKPDTPDVVPTTPPTTAPTATTAPTVEPTVEPTAEPTATSTPVPTEEPVATPEPTAEPTVEPTVAPTVEPTATPTATPTIEPTATPTPKPTSTPTPTPSPKPTATPVPECLHQTETVSILEDTETGTTYQAACADCGEVFEVYTIPKATATPKPTAKPKATATPKPTATPTPKLLAVTPTPAPSHGGVVDEYIVETGDNIVVGFPCEVYADGTRMVTSTKWSGFSTPDGYMTASVNDEVEIVYHKIYYGADNKPEHEELLLKLMNFNPYASSPELLSTVYYCMYYYYDCKTEVLTSRLVNTDGSFNRYSDHVFDGYADYIGGSYRYKYENKKMVEYLENVSIGVEYDGWEIPTEDFIYYDNKNGIVRLYEY